MAEHPPRDGMTSERLRDLATRIERGTYSYREADAVAAFLRAEAARLEQNIYRPATVPVPDVKSSGSNIETTAVVAKTENP